MFCKMCGSPLSTSSCYCANCERWMMENPEKTPVDWTPQEAEPLQVSFRENILKTAATLTCGDRAATYGAPTENLEDIAYLWNAYIYTKYAGEVVDPVAFSLSAEDVAWMNVLIKMARSYKSFKEDNYVDAAAYAAIAGECRQHDEFWREEE